MIGKFLSRAYASIACSSDGRGGTSVSRYAATSVERKSAIYLRILSARGFLRLGAAQWRSAHQSVSAHSCRQPPFEFLVGEMRHLGDVKHDGLRRGLRLWLLEYAKIRPRSSSARIWRGLAHESSRSRRKYREPRREQRIAGACPD